MISKISIAECHKKLQKKDGDQFIFKVKKFAIYCITSKYIRIYAQTYAYIKNILFKKYNNNYKIDKDVKVCEGEIAKVKIQR